VNDDWLPYYYGLNYEAPPGGDDRGALSFRGLGLMVGRAMRQGVVGGVDSGLWLENLVGVPLEPQRMMLNWGNETGGTELWGEVPRSDWTSYRTLPEAVLEFAGLQAERALGPVERSGDILRGKNPYGAVDEVNTPAVVREAAVRDAMEAVGVAATPGMAFSRPSMTTAGVFGGGRKVGVESLPQSKLRAMPPEKLADYTLSTFPEEGIRGAYLSADNAGKALMRERFTSGRKAVDASILDKVKDRFQTAYDAAREKQGGSSFVDIAVLRDNLGLSQEKMAGLLRRASKEGHAVLELGEPSVVDDYLKGGMVDGKLLVRLDPEFFDNIYGYIKQDIRKSISQMEADEIEKQLLR
jgi:hypothetical protein